MFKKEKQLIEKYGLNSTNQRIMILHYILEIADHPTAEDILAWSKENCPKISVATIYNTLNVFVEKNLLKTMTPPDSKVIYYEVNTGHHYHLIDTKSGKFIDIPKDKIEFNHHLDEYLIEKIDVFIYAHKKT